MAIAKAEVLHRLAKMREETRKTDRELASLIKRLDEDLTELAARISLAQARKTSRPTRKPAAKKKVAKKRRR